MKSDSRPIPRASGFLVGRGERPHLGFGWWDRMRSPQRPGLFFRTSHPRAALRLWARPGQEALNLLICASTTMIGGPARLEVLFEDVAGERSLGELEVPWEEWAVHSLPCRISSEGPVTITLKTHTVAVPHAVLNNGDHREFGVHLAAAHLR